MVDPERLHRLLRRASDDLVVLAGYRSTARDPLLRDPVRLGHLKYTFVTLLEACIDAAHHVCASSGYGPVDTNAGAMRLLSRHGVLTGELAETMARAVGFRNVLVHGYAEVDDGKVVGYLDHLGDVRSFLHALSALVVD